MLSPVEHLDRRGRIFGACRTQRKEASSKAALESRDKGELSAAELISSAYELRLAGDAPLSTGRSIESFLELMAPSVRFRFEDGTMSEGREALRAQIAETAQEWASVHYELAEIQELGDSRFLAVGDVLVQARQGDDETSIPFSNIWTVTAGLAERIEAADQ